jgi:DNA-binding CsgD family transcriptional regulator
MFESLLEELVGRTQGIQERAEGVAFLKVSQTVYPLTSTVYLGLNIPLGTDGKRFVQCTYSDEWVKQCVSREPLGVSRLAGLAQAWAAPLDWSELPATPELERLLGYAQDKNGGRQIISIPLRPLIGETAIFFVAAAMPPEEWKERKQVLQREFQVLASYFHQHILRIYGHDASKQILISARELDCLKWVAAGKTAWEASVILGISERTVRFHLNAAREKLNCLTTTQAVAKAVSQQLIEGQ